MKAADHRRRQLSRRLPLSFLYMSLASLLVPAGMAAAQSEPAAATGITAPSLLEREAEARLEAQRQLTTSLAAIAADPSNFFALSQAGRASLAMGDARTAVGFLARAEALQPRDPIVKAALGAALVRMEDPVQAMRYFDSAIAAGGLDRTYMADRGLAFDLMGDQVRAQADYAVAAQSHMTAELVRRHAISLGISGDVDRAVQMLGPLLRAQDRAAWRSRAMILAMNGRAEEARQIAQATMPRQLADGLEPYFALMGRLTPAQLASASHFGRFPGYEVVRNQPERTIGRTEVAAAAATTPPADSRSTGRTGRSRDRTASRPGRQADGRIVVAAASPSPAPTPAPARSATVADIATAPPPPAPRPVVVATPVVQPTPAPSPSAAPSPSTPSVPSPAATTAPAPAPVPAPMSAANAPTADQSAPLPPAPTPAPTPTPVPVRIAAADIPASRPASGSPDMAATAPPPVTVAGPPAAPAPATPADGARIYGPVDSAPGFSATLPVVRSTPVPATATPAAPDPAPVATVASAPVAASAATGDVVLAGWSLDSVVASIEIPEAERAASRAALSAEEVQAIAEAQRQRQASEAATARADAEARRRTEAEARRRAEAEAAARAEAERVRRNPARVWVQVATGADLNALGYDCRRLARQYAASFQGQSCSAAVWNRTRRLLVGPFRNAAAARTWLASYSAAGGDGFVWNSDAGEDVVPVGRR